MMTNRQLIATLSAVLTTLAETTQPGGFAIASYIYLALGSDYDLYQRVVRVGERAGWLTSTAETVSITPKGRIKAEEIAAVMG